MGSTLSAPWAYLQKQGWPWMGIPASLEIFLSWSVKALWQSRKLFILTSSPAVAVDRVLPCIQPGLFDLDTNTTFWIKRVIIRSLNIMNSRNPQAPHNGSWILGNCGCSSGRLKQKNIYQMHLQLSTEPTWAGVPCTASEVQSKRWPTLWSQCLCGTVCSSYPTLPGLVWRLLCSAKEVSGLINTA